MKIKRFDFNYKPLQVNYSASLVGGVPNEQTYDADSGEYSPDYSLTPCVIQPQVNIIDRDRILPSGNVNAQLTDVSWRRVINGVEERDALVSTANKYVITTSGDENGKLKWYINATPQNPILLRFKAKFLDTRTKQVYNILIDYSLKCRNATRYAPMLLLSSGTTYYNPLRDTDVQTIVASLHLGSKECEASKRAFVWEIGRSDGYFTAVTADDMEISISADGTTATLDRSIMGDRISIRCRAKYSATGNPSAVTLTDSAPFKTINIVRRIPSFDYDIQEAVSDIDPGTKSVLPVSYIYDNVGEIPNPTKELLPLWYMATNSHSSAIVYDLVGHGMNPVIPTDKMDASIGGIVKLDVKILKPWALLTDGKGRVLTDGKGNPFVFH